MDALGDLIYKLVPFIIPAALVWSFLLNHDMTPSGGAKDKGEKKESSKKSETKDTEAPPSKPPTNGES